MSCMSAPQGNDQERGFSPSSRKIKAGSGPLRPLSVYGRGPDPTFAPDSGSWTLGSWTLDSGLWILDSGILDSDSGLRILDPGLWKGPLSGPYT